MYYAVHVHGTIELNESFHLLRNKFIQYRENDTTITKNVKEEEEEA